MSNPIVVLKFGGSSVGEVRHWKTIHQQVARHFERGRSVVLVLSALKSISNMLEALLHQAVAGVHHGAIAHLKEHHLGFAAQLGLSMESELAPWFCQLSSDCEAIYRQQHISPQLHASVLSVGELLSSTIGYCFLKSRLPSCEFQDVRNWLQADDRKEQDPWHHYTSNSCDYSERKSLIAELVANPRITVTQGFIACDRDGQTVLLGREGSDTSAAYLAAMLGAEQLDIWTDVPGVFTFNPRLIAQAKVLSKLSYRQAEILARSGAKVLHPRALAPAWTRQIPLSVKCTAMPEQTGTLLVDQIADYQGPLAMAAESDLLYVRLLEGDSNRLLAELSRMGFDCCQALAQQQWLLRYSNSDIEQPSNDELQALLHPFRIESKSQVSSISLVGQGQNWQSQVKAQVSAIAEQRAIVFEWLDSQDPEHLILRVSQQQHEAMCRLLHQQIFENYEWPSSSTTGLSLWRESWQQLIEHR